MIAPPRRFCRLLQRLQQLALVAIELGSRQLGKVTEVWFSGGEIWIAVEPVIVLLNGLQICV